MEEASFDKILTQLGTGRWNIMYYVIIMYCKYITWSTICFITSGKYFLIVGMLRQCTEL